MSLLPQQIPPQTEPWGKADDRGIVTVDINWWLFLFNISKQVLGGAGIPPLNPPGNVPIQLRPPAFITLTSDGDDAADGFSIPGPQGLRGITGLTIPGQDGIDGEDGFSIPGPPGTAGLASALTIIMEAEAGEDGLPAPSTGFGALTSFAGIISATGSPLTQNATRAVTAISGIKASNAQSTSSALTADTDLTLTFNEIGTYALDGYLSFYETTLGTGGFQFDFNSGTATVGAINFGVDGYVTAAVGNAAVTSVSTATSFGTIVTSSSAPSWLRITGYLTVTGIGTFALRWAQASTLALDPTNLLAGSRLVATKIG